MNNGVLGGKSKRGQVNVEGSAAWLPSPPSRNSGDTKPSTVAGSGPNAGNPAGGADGVWLGSEPELQQFTMDARGAPQEVPLLIRRMSSRSSGSILSLPG